MRFFRPTVSRLLDLVLPPRCPMTGSLVGSNGTLDPAYWAQLHFIHDSFCDRCGAPFAVPITGTMVCGHCLQDPPPYAKSRSALRYEAASSKMILKFKHADGTHLAPLFGKWLVQSGAELLDDSDIIVPVPLHRWRLLRRRFNQAALLGMQLEKLTGVKHIPHVLRRARHTQSQGQKNKSDRAKNVSNAFTVRKADEIFLKDKTVLLVDDVYTSGATVNECTKALLSHGAAKVHVLTIARAGWAG